MRSLPSSCLTGASSFCTCSVHWDQTASTSQEHLLSSFGSCRKGGWKKGPGLTILPHAQSREPGPGGNRVQENCTWQWGKEPTIILQLYFHIKEENNSLHNKGSKSSLSSGAALLAKLEEGRVFLSPSRTRSHVSSTIPRIMLRLWQELTLGTGGCSQQPCPRAQPFPGRAGEAWEHGTMTPHEEDPMQPSAITYTPASAPQN